MTDIGWLRNFNRSRSAAAGASGGQSSASSSAAPNNSSSFHDNGPPEVHQQQGQHSPARRRAAVHRVSSFLSLGGSSTREHYLDRVPSPTKSWDGSGGGAGGDVDSSGNSGGGGDLESGGDPEIAWHNPNLMQLVETLQAAMISKRDALAPIPVMYNAYVLALLEGFGRVTKELRTAEDRLDELKNLREKELEQFRSMSEEWMRREGDYKAEIKRLELTLAKESKDGVLSVALARQESKIDRSASKRFQARLKRLSNSQEQELNKKIPEEEERQKVDLSEATACYKTIGDMPRIHDPNNDVLMSRFVEEREKFDGRFQREQQQRDRFASNPVDTMRPRRSRKTNDKPQPYPDSSSSSNHSATTLGSPQRQDFVSSRVPVAPHLNHSVSHAFHGNDWTESFQAQTGGEVANVGTKPGDNKPKSPVETAEFTANSMTVTDVPSQLRALQKNGNGPKYDKPSLATRPRRSRGYSFEKGDDDTISVPTLVLRGHPRLMSTPPATDLSEPQNANIPTHYSRSLDSVDPLEAPIDGSMEGLTWQSSAKNTRPALQESSSYSSSLVSRAISTHEFNSCSLHPSTSTGSVVWVGDRESLSKNTANRARHLSSALAESEGDQSTNKHTADGDLMSLSSGGGYFYMAYAAPSSARILPGVVLTPPSRNGTVETPMDARRESAGNFGISGAATPIKGRNMETRASSSQSVVPSKVPSAATNVVAMPYAPNASTASEAARVAAVRALTLQSHSASPDDGSIRSRKG
ncbi:hypothetical protein B0H63DRAFT_479546 [Podospora didyma]|uniref:Uncharacterized protein n=1 Tax=Podospora didyma TaxID=330526 RepID=A0AAE0KKU0_9PEZI|nr:hypothetical protein B0H63DRAFT_479546 [Podospora didyma]